MTKGKKILTHAILILASFLSVFPLYYMLCGATNPSIDVIRGKLIPGTYLIENFKALVANQNLALAMTNSFRNAILMTFITLLVCSIAGYGFEIYHDKAKDILMSVLLLAMILFLKFGFSFLSQIPFLMHPTVRYKARHINTIHSPERSCLLSFPMAIWVSITASNPQKASQHPLCSIFRSFSSCNSSRLLFVFFILVILPK